ncbi:MAG TPA: preprotein translocase subunit SecG [Mariprofundaceae bacterium]|nr:preprotein translocase subunit SecG [Mariprofundaceae bacterium]
MTILIVSLHVLAAFALIGVVLMQQGQGADMGASFGGGGAQTLFGSRGSGSFLGKVTGGLAALFMITSLTLAFFSQQQAGSVVEKAAQQEMPAPDGKQDFTLDPSKLKDSGGAKKAQSEQLPKAQ